MKELGELHSSDSEPEDFCICKDSCSNTLCLCLAIKQEPCQSLMCKCDRAICSNRPGTSHSEATTGVQALPGPSASIEQDVHRYCDTHLKEMKKQSTRTYPPLLITSEDRQTDGLSDQGGVGGPISYYGLQMSTTLEKNVTTSEKQATSNAPFLSPSWCKCGK